MFVGNAQYAPWPFNLWLRHPSTPDGLPPDGSGRPPVGYPVSPGDPAGGYRDKEGNRIPSEADLAAKGLPNPYKLWEAAKTDANLGASFWAVPVQWEVKDGVKWPVPPDAPKAPETPLDPLMAILARLESLERAVALSKQ